MLVRFHDLRGRPVCDCQGACGKLDDVLFDDRSAQVRYVVLAVGRWPRRRRVLVDPALLSDEIEGALALAMTRADVHSAPGLDDHPPVSRQHELSPGLLDPNVPAWHSPAQPDGIPQSMEDEAAREVQREAEESQLERTPFDAMLPQATREPDSAHLRSVREVIGYRAELSDGGAGRVADAWLDTTRWQLAHLSLRLPLRRVTWRAGVPATLVRAVSWSARTVRLSALRGRSNSISMVPLQAPPRSFAHAWSNAAALAASLVATRQLRTP